MVLSCIRCGKHNNSQHIFLVANRTFMFQNGKYWEIFVGNYKIIFMATMKKDHAHTLKDSKRFWSLVKALTRSHQSPSFLRKGRILYTTNSDEKA